MVKGGTKQTGRQGNPRLHKAIDDNYYELIRPQLPRTMCRNQLADAKNQAHTISIKSESWTDYIFNLYANFHVQRCIPTMITPL